MLINITVSCFNQLYNNSINAINNTLKIMYCHPRLVEHSNYACQNYGCPIITPKTEHSDTTVLLLQGVNECIRINEDKINMQINDHGRTILSGYEYLPSIQRVLGAFNITSKDNFENAYKKCIASLYNVDIDIDIDTHNPNCSDVDINLFRIQYLATGFGLAVVGFLSFLAIKQLKNIIKAKQKLNERVVEYIVLENL